MLDATIIIFTILTEIRRGVQPSRIWKTFSRFGEPLSPRLPFWVHLCQQAGLISGGPSLHPTRFVKKWLVLSPKEKTLILLDAWSSYPKHSSDRIARKKLLSRLKNGVLLNHRDQRDLPGLEALGICHAEKITAWGRIILMDGMEPTLHSPTPWHLGECNLTVPFPPDWPLLWELESFLCPTSPGFYSLEQSSLRKAAQFGKNSYGNSGWEDNLIRIMEKGLDKKMPRELKARIYSQPVCKVAKGTLLEFSNPQELKQLRRSPTVQKYLTQIFSPRVVYIEPQSAPPLLKLLEKRGIHVRGLLEEETENSSDKKRTYIYQQIPSPPDPRNTPLPSLLAEYQRLQQALDILYHAPNSVRPEPRRITPLLQEERGGQVYVIAYCHTRRARRTFRLDRIEIPGNRS